MKLINAAMQNIVDESEFDAAQDRRLERPLWITGGTFGAAVIMTSVLQGASWLIVLLSVISGGILGEIAGCRRRRRRALMRAARFRRLLLIAWVSDANH